MGIKSYQNINDLISDLEKKLAGLNSGNLSIGVLDESLELSRELYERLIVLRHKARELSVHTEKKKEENTYAPPVEKPAAKKEKPMVAAETTAKKSDPVVNQEPVLSELPSFDFTTAEPIAETVTEPIAVAIDEVKEDNVPTVKRAPRSKKLVLPESVEPTLKDKIGTDDGQSLRKKLQNAPVKDITKEISIGKKFEYISLMFKGDGKSYDQAINSLNSCNNFDEAKGLIDGYSGNYGWNLEDKTVVKFIELVERRYA